MTPPDDAGRERVLSTALARFRVPRGLDPEEFRQAAWLALLEAERSYDPARHRCRREAYLVVRVRAALSRVCRRAARGRDARPLPDGLVSRDMGPVELAIAAEASRRVRKGRRALQRNPEMKRNPPPCNETPTDIQSAGVAASPSSSSPSGP